jgi:hypothetical protein
MNNVEFRTAVTIFPASDLSPCDVSRESPIVEYLCETAWTSDDSRKPGRIGRGAHSQRTLSGQTTFSQAFHAEL